MNGSVSKSEKAFVNLIQLFLDSIALVELVAKAPKLHVIEDHGIELTKKNSNSRRNNHTPSSYDRRFGYRRFEYKCRNVFRRSSSRN